MAYAEITQKLIGNLEELAKWEADLMSGLAETRAKKGELLGALERVIRLLPVGEKLPYRAQIARIQLPLRRARRKGSLAERKADAVVTFLATAEDSFTTAQLQEYLTSAGVTTHKNDAASFLHRRVKEGMAERLRRGLYQSIKSHPLLAKRRLRMVGL